MTPSTEIQTQDPSLSPPAPSVEVGQTIEKKASNVPIYWAREEDEKKLLGELSKRRDTYFRWIDSSRLFQRIMRLWTQYSGLQLDHMPTAGDTEIHIGGEDGELTYISVNHLRSILYLMAGYIVQGRPAWDCIAKNLDNGSLSDAMLGNHVLNDALESKKIESKLRRAVEHSLALTEGLIGTIWDPSMGPPIDALVDDPANPQILYSGDARIWNPTIFDVVRDFGIMDWTEHKWWYFRRPESKWAVASRYPHLAEKILAAPPSREKDKTHRFYSNFYLRPQDTDIIDVWHFIHMPCEELPLGRYVSTIDESFALEKREYDSRVRPIHRIIPSEQLLTGFGRSPGFDLMAAQDMIDAEFSTVATNHNNFGQLKMWVKAGNSLNIADLDSGSTVIECEDEPKVLQLLQTPNEIYETIKLVVNHMELTSGMNGVVRGDPPASLKSGPSLAMVNQKAYEYSAPMQSMYYDLMSDVGTAFIGLLQEHAEEPMVVAMAGVANRMKLRQFSKKDLGAIDRVRVIPGSSFLRTMQGRWQFAELLLQNKIVTTKEEILTILNTGQIESLMQADAAQLNAIHDENDALRQGQQVEAFATDNQVLHIREHMGVFDSMAARSDPVLLEVVLGHINHHMDLLMDPRTQLIQVILQYTSFTEIQPLLAQPAAMGQGMGGGMDQPQPEDGAPGPRLVGGNESPALKQVEGQNKGMPPEAIQTAQAAMKNAGIA